MTTNQDFIRVSKGVDDRTNAPMWHLEILCDARWRSIRATYDKETAMDLMRMIRKSVKQNREAARSVAK